MSKFAKMCCILGGIIFAIGVILCIIGFTMGFSINESSQGPRISNFISGFGYDEDETVVYEEMAEADETYEFSTADIHKLDIEVEYGTLIIETHSEDYIAVSTSQADSEFRCEKSGETLAIKDEHKGYLGIFDTESSDSYVYVFIPKDMIFDEIDIEIDAGSADVEDLAGKDISVKVGAGTFSGGNIISTGKAKFEVGAGSVRLDISGNESDYNYDIDCGIGKIRIGESEFSSLSGRKRIDNNSDIDFKIDCGIGEVELDFFE